MYKKPHFLAGLAAAAVVLSMLANRTWAQGPDRVPRFMMTFHWVGEPPVPLDWDAEGSVAMVVMPQVVAETTTRYFAKACDYDFYGNRDYRDRMYNAIVNTLERNLADRISAGDIEEEEIPVISDLVFDAMDGGSFYRYHEVTHVAKSGVERLTNVYFDSVPPQGAMAQAGPDGDILVLGEFWVDMIHPGESPCNPGSGELVITDSTQSHLIQLAIGWFTK